MPRRRGCADQKSDFTVVAPWSFTGKLHPVARNLVDVRFSARQFPVPPQRNVFLKRRDVWKFGIMVSPAIAVIVSSFLFWYFLCKTFFFSFLKYFSVNILWFCLCWFISLVLFWYFLCKEKFSCIKYLFFCKTYFSINILWFCLFCLFLLFSFGIFFVKRSFLI